jgi:predicted branched-subunit amino acid permease
MRPMALVDTTTLTDESWQVCLSRLHRTNATARFANMKSTFWMT